MCVRAQPQMGHTHTHAPRPQGLGTITEERTERFEEPEVIE